ncbi:hypothetical protein K2173_002563 [Erythroxylum novogranatense]|uniref:B-like cyclin n=1 Tax=Erythroxylum novogranatense TaxID=1862640 RepID=A0AAV8TTE9_9ROSI|nr:hypothetical protein K2173_002563 [Erythroxylum novogranatense]
MSDSTDCSALLHLYCNEITIDSICSDTEISENHSPYSSDFLIDDDSHIDSIFNSEQDQMIEPKLETHILEIPGTDIARQDAVTWMLKVHAYYQFRPETAYLSVNYLDRFLLSQTLPQEKGWILQLLAVACLSLATKMEERRVPLLLDLQILEPKFLFTPSTIQRMELLIMNSLNWRLHIITPFNFLHYFIAKLPYLVPDCYTFDYVFTRSSHLIISISSVTNFLEYAPSAVAVAVVTWVTNRAIDDPNFWCFDNRVNKEMVKRCYNVIKRSKSQLAQREVIDAIVRGKCQA